jgi:hypothetical protein
MQGLDLEELMIKNAGIFYKVLENFFEIKQLLYLDAIF